MQHSHGVIFRCDASQSIGTGHVARCKVLAHLLKRRGCRPVFFCRDHEDSLHRQILHGEFECVTLPRRQQSVSVIEPSPYAEWLGCSQKQDASDCLSGLAELSDFHASYVVVDHYALDHAWEGCLLSALSGAKLLVIDDLADRPHAADWLVDTGRLHGWSDPAYAQLVNSKCQMLLGPRYSLLSEDYGKLRECTEERMDLRRVLVFFGGVDRSNWCSLALKALSHPQLEDLQVDVVLCAGATHVQAIQKFVAHRAGWTLHVGLPTLSPLVASADVALGAAGSHSWERASLGLPAMAVAVAENQVELLAALVGEGLVECPDVDKRSETVDAFAQFLIGLRRDPEKLRLMSVSAAAIVDACGVSRVCSAMLGVNPPLRLRPALSTDMGLYFWWVNDPDVRRSSLQTGLISFEQHCRWFQARVSSDTALMHVLVDSDDLPVGQIRFERLDSDSNQAFVSFSLDRLARGQGLAGRLLSLGLDAMRNQWGHHMDVVAEVKAENLASARVFLRAGFRELARSNKGVRCFVQDSTTPCGECP